MTNEEAVTITHVRKVSVLNENIVRDIKGFQKDYRGKNSRT